MNIFASCLIRRVAAISLKLPLNNAAAALPQARTLDYNDGSSERETATVPDLKPCVRCEQELPPPAFSDAENIFCKDCMEEIVSIIRSKYSAIEAAHFRARLRRRSREAMEELRRKSS